MKFLRLRISTEFLKSIGFSDLFKDIERLEILHTYQYDRENFFSMQKITFKQGSLAKLNGIVKNTFNAVAFQVIEMKNHEMTCILKQSRKPGFWPDFFEPGPWALMTPIYCDRDNINVTIISEETYVEKIHKQISKITEDYDVLAQTNMEEGLVTNLLPNFTQRQREIAKFATSKGFFDSPKKITAEQIGNRMNPKISVSTVNEHLRNISRIAMNFLFG